MLDVDLHHGASTDVGLVRKVNEDSYLVAPPVFVVADGMGGHAGGDVASAVAVAELIGLDDALPRPTDVPLVEPRSSRAQPLAEPGTGSRRAWWPEA